MSGLAFAPNADLTRFVVKGTLRSVWADADNTFVAVGVDSPTVFDGRNALKFEPDMKNADLWGVWGSDSKNIFAVGASHEILHFDGNAWSTMLNEAPYLHSIWGTSDTNVFAVGLNGVILHYDGSVWSQMRTGVDEVLLSVHGSSSKNVFVAGQSVVLHFDGTEWSQVDNVPESLFFSAVWVASGGDAFFGCGEGAVTRYDGQVWSTVSLGTPDPIRAIVGRSKNEIYAATDHAVFRFDGREWSLFRKNPSHFWSRDLAFNSVGDLAIVGYVCEPSNKVGSDRWHCSEGSILHFGHAALK